MKTTIVLLSGVIAVASERQRWETDAMPDDFVT
jgi:hypothetical protein